MPTAPAAPTLAVAALSQLAEGVILTDAAGRITFVNEAAARLHGVARLAVEPERYADTYQLLTETGEPYPSTELPLARAVLRGETVTDARWRIRRPDGSEVFAVGSARPVLGADGEQLGAVLTVRDDTPRVEAERAEHRAARILEQIADEHLTFDRDFRILSVNRAAERALGMPASALIGLTHWEAFPASVGSPVEAQYRRVVEERVEVHLSHHYVGEGYDRHIEIDAYPTEEGGAAVFWREVTARVKAEQALRELTTRYQALFESVDTGFAIIEILHDASGAPTDYRFVEANRAFETHTGLTAAVGRTARELVENLEPFWVETYASVAETGESVRFQEGSDVMGRWFDVFAMRIGEPAEHRVALLFTDITAARQAAVERETLLETVIMERARLEEVFRQAPAFLAVLQGSDYVFTLVNEAYYRLVGRRPLLGLPVWDALPEVRGQGFEALLDGVIRTGEPFVGHALPVSVARTPGAPPEERFVDLTYVAMTAVDGERTGVIAHGVDVTGQVHARRDIERLLRESEIARTEAEAARAEAEAANRAKSEFLAVMSHELRTPLNAIDGYAELMELGIRGPVTEAQREDLRRIRRSERHLLGLINGVLNYAQVEAGAVHFEWEDVPVDEVLATCEALTTPQVHARGLRLLRAPCDPGLQVRADREKTRQIVLNLLSNAAKFTAPGGTVSVRCSVVEPADTGQSEWVRIEVADTGIGIPTDQLGRVFEPFVQIDAGLTRTGDGAGLGLAISRDLARAMGGDLTVESTLGVGSTFTLTLPTAGRA